MLTEFFTTKQFNKLQPYILPRNITSIESDLFVVFLKNNKYLLKKYRKTDGEYFGNKLLTINSLIDNKENINIEELVFPEMLAIVNKIIVGYIMPLIEHNTNLEQLLANNQIDTKFKIDWLKQVGNIISQVHYVELKSGNFLLGDIHESNFILNHDTKRIVGVDLDGCKIGNNKISSMRYGSFNEKFFGLPNKYPLDEDDEPIPNYNTELYCYAMMVLNTIAHGPVYKLLIQDYYDYIQFLRDTDFPLELIDCFINLYSNGDNYLPRELLDLIPSNLKKVNFYSFVEKANIKYLK